MTCKHCNDTGTVLVDGVKRPCFKCQPVEQDAPATGKAQGGVSSEIKTLTVEKMDGVGQGLARIALLSEVDNDGDTYVPGAFSWKEGGEQWVPILPAHQRTAMPIGKARIYEDGNAVYAELHLNLDTQAGSDWHKALKFDLEHGKSVQEYSYGFGVLDYALERRDGAEVRVLKRLDVHEVSPVVRGAGVGTGTLQMKSDQGGSFAGQIDAVLAEVSDIVERAGSVKALREAQGRDMSPARMAQLKSLHQKLGGILDLDAEGGNDQEADAQAKAKELDEANRLAAQFMTRSARKQFG
ncbi:HK97 family phage prohead protease [Roseibium sp.]|uniref:HK97 family phage prohead protease n=1 Tax=Roseibium sp. TaxID=1936156 RepID=UPI00326733FB